MSHLRIVRDEPPKRRERRPHVNHVLTHAEQAQARAALKGLRNAFGSWSALAAAMDVRITTLMAAARGAYNVSAALLVRASRASGLSIGDLLGKPIAADRCRACGQIKRRVA
ncbi:MAG: transcriptional regulator [Polyangiaceae bacterium]|nr:transcriptional regulator [Polyangiaceae bacterium]